MPPIDAVLFDIGNTLVRPAPAATPTRELVAQPLPRVVPTLRCLARTFRLGAVTDTAVMSENEVRRLLYPTGIDELLEVVVTSADVGAEKPSPLGILAACEQMGIDPSRVLYVGDQERDRQAAQAAGTHFAAVGALAEPEGSGAEAANGQTIEVDRAVLGFLLGSTTPFDACRALLADLGVELLDQEAESAARSRQDVLTKPAGSLGFLEEISIQLAGIFGESPPPVPAPATVVVFAADHGVHAEAVTPWPQEITAAMVANFCAGGAAINAFARQAGAQVVVVDVGVATELPDLPGLRSHKVRAGTANLARGPAMSREDVADALDVGAAMAAAAVAEGARCLVTGDMGIANTTASAAVIGAFTGLPAEAVTGRGTGIDDPMLLHKIEVISGALDRLGDAAAADPIEVLAQVGGLEIVALAGFIVGGAAHRVPVIVDGVIAGAALLAASRLVPGVERFCIAGHRSAEPGGTVVLEKLGMRPLIELDLRLGEGTGAALALPLVQASARALREMATLDDLGA